MNSFRFPNFSKLALIAFSALTVGVSASSAQASRGQFTLPFETHWGSVVMAPGPYSYTLDRATVGFVLSIQGKAGLIRMPAVGSVSVGEPFKGSTLLLITRGQQTWVRSMQFGHLGLTVRYAAAKPEGASSSGRKESHKNS